MIKYLSNSSIGEWNLCQEKFRLKRLCGKKYPRHPSLPPDAGTVFDILCKSAINRRITEEFPENLHPDAMRWGTDMFNLYKASGAFQLLLDEGVGVVTAGIEKILNDVPVYGLPDIIMADGMIRDWKTNGVGSTNGAYAKPGYYRRVDCEIGSKHFHRKPAHAKTGCNMEDISPQWAKQTCTYSYLNGRKPTDNFLVGIEQVAVHGTKLSICSYRGKLSKDFKEEVWEEYPRIWKRLQRKFFEVPIVSKFRCRAFGKRCEVSDDCVAFQRHLQEMQKEDNED